MRSNDDIIAMISEATFGSGKSLISSKKIKIKDLFPESKNQEKMIFENVDFFRLGPILNNFDFSGCIFKNCRFDHLKLLFCNFDDPDLKNDSFPDCYLASSTEVPFPKVIKAKHQDLEISEYLDYLLGVDKEEESRKRRCFDEQKHYWEERCRKSPEDFLIFSKIVFKHVEPSFPMQLIQDYYYFTYPEAQPSEYVPGWKLHISIDREIKNMKRAFDLLVPYLAKHGYYFKFTFPDFSRSGRLFTNGQFTIYLTMKKGSISAEKVKAMITHITEVFSKNDVKPAENLPSPDAQTISPYFSLRNDAVYIPASFEQPKIYQDAYLEAMNAGRHFNPCRYPNPYQKLLKNETEPTFNMLEHFLDFDINKESQTTRPQGYIALKCTLIAYLRTYSTFDNLEEKEALLFKNQCIKNLKIDDRFIKENVRQQADIREGIRTAFVILNYLFNKTADLDALPIFSHYFLLQTPFLTSLKKIEECIGSLDPIDKTSIHRSNFTEIMQKLERQKAKPALKINVSEISTFTKTDTPIERLIPSIEQKFKKLIM